MTSPSNTAWAREELGEIARQIAWKHLGAHWRKAWYKKLVHDIESALLAVDRKAKEEQWQPIETAPKDGTRVILGWDDSAALPMHSELGRFRSGTGVGSGWANTYGHAFSGIPTHWMHLPPAPRSTLPPTSKAE